MINKVLPTYELEKPIKESAARLTVENAGIDGPKGIQLIAKVDESLNDCDIELISGLNKSSNYTPKQFLDKNPGATIEASVYYKKSYAPYRKWYKTEIIKYSEYNKIYTNKYYKSSDSEYTLLYTDYNTDIYKYFKKNENTGCWDIYDPTTYAISHKKAVEYNTEKKSIILYSDDIEIGVHPNEDEDDYVMFVKYDSSNAVSIGLNNLEVEYATKISDIGSNTATNDNNHYINKYLEYEPTSTNHILHAYNPVTGVDVIQYKYTNSSHYYDLKINDSSIKGGPEADKSLLWTNDTNGRSFVVGKRIGSIIDDDAVINYSHDNGLRMFGDTLGMKYDNGRISTINKIFTGDDKTVWVVNSGETMKINGKAYTNNTNRTWIYSPKLSQQQIDSTATSGNYAEIDNKAIYDLIFPVRAYQYNLGKGGTPAKTVTTYKLSVKKPSARDGYLYSQGYKANDALDYIQCGCYSDVCYVITTSGDLYEIDSGKVGPNDLYSGYYAQRIRADGQIDTRPSKRLSQVRLSESLSVAYIFCTRNVQPGYYGDAAEKTTQVTNFINKFLGGKSPTTQDAQGAWMYAGDYKLTGCDNVESTSKSHKLYPAPIKRYTEGYETISPALKDEYTTYDGYKSNGTYETHYPAEEYPRKSIPSFKLTHYIDDNGNDTGRLALQFSLRSSKEGWQRDLLFISYTKEEAKSLKLINDVSHFTWDMFYMRTSTTDKNNNGCGLWITGDDNKDYTGITKMSYNGKTYYYVSTSSHIKLLQLDPNKEYDILSVKRSGVWYGSNPLLKDIIVARPGNEYAYSTYKYADTFCSPDNILNKTEPNFNDDNILENSTSVLNWAGLDVSDPDNF